MRSIIKSAGANLGAVNYHFGSKDQLIAEVLIRRMRPIDQARLARLDELEKDAGPEGLKLEAVLDALVRPLVESENIAGNQSKAVQLIGRAFQEADANINALIQSAFGELAKRFDAAISRCLPDLPLGELAWRMSLLLGALHHGLTIWTGPPIAPPRMFVPAILDREDFIRQFISFAAAGLSTPSLLRLSPTPAPQTQD